MLLLGHDVGMRLATLLFRSNALHQALDEAVGDLDCVSSAHRATVAMDALMVSRQHADALRMLLSGDLGSTAIGVLRMQYEALLRATWALFAASSQAIAALVAPLTSGTSKAANSLGLPNERLKAIEKSHAPEHLTAHCPSSVRTRGTSRTRTSTGASILYGATWLTTKRTHNSAEDVERPSLDFLCADGGSWREAETPGRHQCRVRRVPGVLAAATLALTRKPAWQTVILRISPTQHVERQVTAKVVVQWLSSRGSSQSEADRGDPTLDAGTSLRSAELPPILKSFFQGQLPVLNKLDNIFRHATALNRASLEATTAAVPAPAIRTSPSPPPEREAPPGAEALAL